MFCIRRIHCRGAEDAERQPEDSQEWLSHELRG